MKRMGERTHMARCTQRQGAGVKVDPWAQFLWLRKLDHRCGRARALARFRKSRIEPLRRCPPAEKSPLEDLCQSPGLQSLAPRWTRWFEARDAGAHILVRLQPFEEACKVFSPVFAESSPDKTERIQSLLLIIGTPVFVYVWVHCTIRWVRAVRLARHLARSLYSKKCPVCLYNLLPDLPMADIATRCSPSVCPECGLRWPLVPCDVYLCSDEKFARLLTRR